jgi:ERCC4-type nuclease
MNNYVIVVDTREKKRILFAKNDYVSKKLDTGDYSIQGYEDVLSIERKATVSELCQNIIDDRFWREIERLSAFPEKCLVCEFGLHDILRYPKGSGIPRRRWKYIRIKPKFILSSLYKIENEYGIPVYFCGSRQGVKQKIRELCKKCHEIYSQL